MNTKPLVSVIIPCYNAEKFVSQSVYSVINQTYTNLEIIVIDDCSTDGTLDILNNIAVLDSRVVVIRNEYNLKLPATLNVGIAQSRGSYIARMDADDISVENRIQLQLDFLMNNELIDIVGGNISAISENGESLKYVSNQYLAHEDITSNLPIKCTMMHPTIMAKRSFFTDVGDFDKDVSFGEDYDYWIRAWLMGKKFANIPNVLLFYRHHRQAMTGVKYNSKNAKSLRKLKFKFFKKTKNPLFLIGMSVHNKFVQNVIVLSNHFRR